MPLLGLNLAKAFFYINTKIEEITEKGISEKQKINKFRN